jgi:iron complex transport system ATP-binding protein
MRIEFQDISVKVQNTMILNRVSVAAESGKVTGILGPNGSGKSTLIKTLFSITEYQSGRIITGDKELNKKNFKEITSLIGYVGQESQLVFDFTVWETVEMGLYNSPVKKDKKDKIIKNIFVSLGILSLKERSILSLSGGERKMVYLARALVGGAETIVLDEPMNNLDIKYQLFILDYLKKSKKTVIIILHDLNLAARYCDTIYLLKDGKNVYSGPPMEVLQPGCISDVFEVSGKAVEIEGEYYLHLEMENIK